jgi:hypothetical protein
MTLALFSFPSMTHRNATPRPTYETLLLSNAFPTPFECFYDYHLSSGSSSTSLLC